MTCNSFLHEFPAIKASHHEFRQAESLNQPGPDRVRPDRSTARVFLWVALLRCCLLTGVCASAQRLPQLVLEQHDWRHFPAWRQHGCGGVP